MLENHKDYNNMAETIPEKLDLLANFQAERDVLELQKKALIEALFTPEIKARLDEIEAEFEGQFEAVDQNIAELEEQIKVEVARLGASFKGTFLQAVCNRGRVSWNTEALDRYAQSHPEILRFRRQGDPYTSIRKFG